MRLLWVLVKLAVLMVALGAGAGVAAYLTIQSATTARKVEVPGIVGMDVPAATRKLEGAGLHIDFEPEEKNTYDESVPASPVLKQDPPPGAFLKQDRRVRVALSLGSRNLYVPRVV